MGSTLNCVWEGFLPPKEASVSLLTVSMLDLKIPKPGAPVKCPNVIKMNVDFNFINSCAITCP